MGPARGGDGIIAGPGNDEDAVSGGRCCGPEDGWPGFYRIDRFMIGRGGGNFGRGRIVPPVGIERARRGDALAAGIGGRALGVARLPGGRERIGQGCDGFGEAGGDAVEQEEQKFHELHDGGMMVIGVRLAGMTEVFKYDFEVFGQGFTRGRCLGHMGL